MAAIIGQLYRVTLGAWPPSSRNAKAYRIRCKGKNVLLKHKDGVGLELQRGEASGMLSSKKKRSVGGGIDMKTNVQVIELVSPSSWPRCARACVGTDAAPLTPQFRSRAYVGNRRPAITLVGPSAAEPRALRLPRVAIANGALVWSGRSVGTTARQTKALSGSAGEGGGRDSLSLDARDAGRGPPPIGHRRFAHVSLVMFPVCCDLRVYNCRAERN